MESAPSWNRTILYHASRDALSSKTTLILDRLGYHLVSPEDWAELRQTEPERRVELLLVDERRLGEATAYEGEDCDEATPIVLLTGQHGTTGADPRIVGAVKRPAGLHDLYRLMQQVFEDTPRSTPRVATQLRARCARGQRRWDGRVLSLSENGCLMRSPEAIPLGQRVELELSIPQAGALKLDAEATYQLLPDIGLVFNAVQPDHREVLERFVAQSIMAA